MLDLQYLFEIQEELTLGSYRSIESFMAQKFGIDWNSSKQNKDIARFLQNTMTVMLVDCGNYTRYQWMDR